MSRYTAERWYIVPKYTTRPTPEPSVEIHNRRGEYVATFEYEADAERVVEEHNWQLEAAATQVRASETADSRVCPGLNRSSVNQSLRRY